MRKKLKMTFNDRMLVKAHNESQNGLKMGVVKENKKGFSDTPLFKPEQTYLGILMSSK